MARELLAHDSETNFRAIKLQLPPGFVAQKHLHTDFEWVYVLEGELADEFGVYPAGTFKINEKNSIHKTYSTAGCIIIVFTRAQHEVIDE